MNRPTVLNQPQSLRKLTLRPEAKRYALMERAGDAPEARRCPNYPDTTRNRQTAERWLDQRAAYYAGGNQVTIAPDGSWFLVERDGRFVASAAIVEADHA